MGNGNVNDNGNKDGQGEQGRTMGTGEGGAPRTKMPPPRSRSPKTPHTPWCRCRCGVGVGAAASLAAVGSREQGAAALRSLKKRRIIYIMSNPAIMQGNPAYIYTCTREAGGGREALGHCAIAPLRRGAGVQGGAREAPGRRYAGAS